MTEQTKLLIRELLVLGMVATVLLLGSKVVISAIIDSVRAEAIELDLEKEKAKCTRFPSGHRRPYC